MLTGALKDVKPVFTSTSSGGHCLVLGLELGFPDALGWMNGDELQPPSCSRRDRQYARVLSQSLGEFFGVLAEKPALTQMCRECSREGRSLFPVLGFLCMRSWFQSVKAMEV